MGGRGPSGSKPPSKDKPLNYQQRQSIRFVDKGEPAFIREMKAKMGYRETTIDDKFAPEQRQTLAEAREEDDVRNLKEDQPQVVVLDSATDLTQEEYDEEVKRKRAEDDKKLIESRQITFKKPAKRKAEDGEEEADDDDGGKPKDKTLRIEAERKRDADIQKKQNTKMLSFGDEEDE